MKKRNRKMRKKRGTEEKRKVKQYEKGHNIRRKIKISKTCGGGRRKRKSRKKKRKERKLEWEKRKGMMIGGMK